MVVIDGVGLEVEAIKAGAEAAEELKAALHSFAAADTDVMHAAESMQDILAGGLYLGS